MDMRVRDYTYFYTGLYDDEQKAESLAEIQANNQEQVGDAWFPCGKVYETEYIIRESKSHHTWAILIERPDGKREDFVTEVRNPWLADAFRKLCDEFGDKAVDAIKKWEPIYCKERICFANCYNSDHSRLVNAAYIGIERELRNEQNLSVLSNGCKYPSEYTGRACRDVVEISGAVDVAPSSVVFDTAHQSVGR